MATLRLGSRVVIGPQQEHRPRLQRLANHARLVLAQPVRVGLLPQPWRRMRSWSLPRQHFLHCFSVQIPSGERDVRTSENYPSTHPEVERQERWPEARSCTPRLYRRMSGLLAHALKQEICLPVARLLLLVQTYSQLFKLAASRGLNNGRAR